jgi:hypothetical protein
LVEKRWRVGGRGDVLSMGVGGLASCSCDMVPSFIHLFPFLGGEKLMEVGGFPFLSQLSQHMGCSPLFSLLCLFHLFS